MTGSNLKRLYLLLPLITVFLMSFEHKSIKKEMSVDTCFPSVYLSSVFPFPLVIETGLREIDEEVDSQTAVSGVKKGHIKYKKKFKRPQVSIGIRPPAKDIERVDFNSTSKPTYSKPYFLSHLHHFLFRLTPF